MNHTPETRPYNNVARLTDAECRREAIDLVPLFLDAVDALRPPTPAVVIEHPDRCIVDADPALLSILVEVLVANAIRFATERAEIRVVLGSQPGCSFYIRDNGIGFSRTRAAELFVPPRTGAKEDTTGGLATARRIVALHEGRLWGEGEPGWGATIFVRLAPGR